jgi:hypothetical protein
MNRMIVLSTAGVPHFMLTVLLAILISGVIALLGRRSRRERVYHAGYLFVCCIASVVAGSWFMYFIHG